MVGGACARTKDWLWAGSVSIEGKHEETTLLPVVWVMFVPVAPVHTQRVSVVCSVSTAGCWLCAVSARVGAGCEQVSKRILAGCSVSTGKVCWVVLSPSTSSVSRVCAASARLVVLTVRGVSTGGGADGARRQHGRWC